MSNKSRFQAELENLINSLSMENGSNTPDYILARYLVACLDAYNNALTERDQWYAPEEPQEPPPPQEMPALPEKFIKDKVSELKAEMAKLSSSKQRFVDLCNIKIGIPGKIAMVIWKRLLKRYSQPNRYYHTFKHVEAMLVQLDDLDIRYPGIHDVRDPALELAIWFHDAEEKEWDSCRFFVGMMKKFVGQKLLHTVGCLILATEHTKERNGVDDEDLIIDLDLSILGSEPGEYKNYREGIRREYAEVPDADFVAGRRKVLEHLMSRKIYNTPYFTHLEERARINMRGELELLGGEKKA